MKSVIIVLFIYRLQVTILQEFHSKKSHVICHFKTTNGEITLYFLDNICK